MFPLLLLIQKNKNCLGTQIKNIAAARYTFLEKKKKNFNYLLCFRMRSVHQTKIKKRKNSFPFTYVLLPILASAHQNNKT